MAWMIKKNIRDMDSHATKQSILWKVLSLRDFLPFTKKPLLKILKLQTWMQLQFEYQEEVSFWKQANQYVLISKYT